MIIGSRHTVKTKRREEDKMKQRIVQAILANLRTWIEEEENPMYSQIYIEFYERLRRL